MGTQETKTNHFISLEKAKKLTIKFKSEKDKIFKDEFKGKDILPFSETFEREAFDVLLKQQGCAGLRIYFGMEEDNKISLVIVGVDERGEDMLAQIPLSDSSLEIATVQALGDPIVENGVKCPPTCPVDSPLNS